MQFKVIIFKTRPHSKLGMVVVLAFSVSPRELLLLPARLPVRRPGVVLAAGAAFEVHAWA